MIISKLQNIDLLVCHYNQGGGLEPQIQQEHFSIISGYCLQLTRVLSVRGEGRMVWRADGPGKRGALCLCVGDVQGDI